MYVLLKTNLFEHFEMHVNIWNIFKILLSVNVVEGNKTPLFKRTFSVLIVLILFAAYVFWYLSILSIVFAPKSIMKMMYVGFVSYVFEYLVLFPGFIQQRPSPNHPQRFGPI